MGHRTLKQDISYSELHTMRDSGMSVKEIAMQLDVSISTIYRYLGSTKDIQASKKPIKREVGYVGKAMVKALNNKYNNQEAKRSMMTCNRCSNCGVACSVCIRNPFLKDYFSNKKGE